MADEVEVVEPTIESTAEPTVEAPATGTAPWSKDLEAMGLGAKGDVVDGYLRETIQPRITQLEQELAGYRNYFPTHEAAEVGAQIAFGLANEETRNDTLRQLKDELGWSDVEIAAAQEAVDAATEDAELEYAQLPPEYAALLERQLQAEQEAERDRILSEFYSGKEAQFGDGFNRDVYEDQFLAGTARGLDVDQIDERYKALIEQMTPPPPPAPQVLTSGATVPPGGEAPQTMDEAAEVLRSMLERK